MSLYNWLVVWIVIMSVMACNFKIKGVTKIIDVTDHSKKIGFILGTSLAIILLTGLRGNITVDYDNYKYLYNYRIKPRTFMEILENDSEVGFGLLQKIVGELSNYDFVVLTLVIAIITVSIYYYVFIKCSKSLWLSVIMLIVLGSYYTSFNTMRQFLAGAMFLFAGIFAWKRKLFEYILTVFFISTFHTSAIVMIPFYWLLDVNWKSKKQLVLSSLCIFGACVILVYLPVVVNYVTRFIYGGYLAERTFNENLSSNILSLIRPIFFIFFVMLNRKVIDWNSRKERWLVNCTFYFMFFQIASYRVYMLYRFTYYFLPFIPILFPELIYKNNNANKKSQNLLMIISIMIVYFIATQLGLDYKFYWE